MSNQKYSIKSISSFQAIVLNAVLLSLCALVSCNQPKPVTSTDAESSELSRTTTEKSPLLGDPADSMFLADRINDRVTQANVSQHPTDTITLTQIPMELLDSIPFMPLMDGDDLVFYSRRNGKLQKHVRPNSILISTSENGQYALISKKTEWPSEYDSVSVIDRYNNLLAEDRMPKLGFESTWQTIIVWDNGKYVLSTNAGHFEEPIVVELFERNNGSFKKNWSSELDGFIDTQVSVNEKRNEICVAKQLSDMSGKSVELVILNIHNKIEWSNRIYGDFKIMALRLLADGSCAIVIKRLADNTKLFYVVDRQNNIIIESPVGRIGNYSIRESSDKNHVIVISGSEYFGVFDRRIGGLVLDNSVLKNQIVTDVDVVNGAIVVLGLLETKRRLEFDSSKAQSVTVVENGTIQSIRVLLNATNPLELMSFNANEFLLNEIGSNVVYTIIK